MCNAKKGSSKTVRIIIELVYIRNGGFEVLQEEFKMKKRYLKDNNILVKRHLRRSLPELIGGRIFCERVYVKDIPEVAGRYVELSANRRVRRRFILRRQ